MSYTFTSPIKNYNNNETLDNYPDMKENLDTIFEVSKTILMVGWRQTSDQTFMKYILDKGKQVTVVEIFEPNLKSIPSEVKIIHGDVLTVPITESYDMFLWQGGPEHVNKESAMELILRIQHQFKYLIIETPNGYNQQEEMYGNIYERHVSHWEPEDYEKIGFLWRPYAGVNHNAFLVGYKEM